jgi:hypothetical protein
MEMMSEGCRNLKRATAQFIAICTVLRRGARTTLDSRGNINADGASTHASLRERTSKLRKHADQEQDSCMQESVQRVESQTTGSLGIF